MQTERNCKHQTSFWYDAWEGAAETGDTGRQTSLYWKESVVGPGESCTQLEAAKERGVFVLIYAVFHPTIKIMDDDIDLPKAVAMTGLRLSGWEKREFSSLSFPDIGRKSLSLRLWINVCLYTCVPEF